MFITIKHQCLILVILCNFVYTSDRYLFETGQILIRNQSRKNVKNKLYEFKNVKHLDETLLGNVKDIKIYTTKIDNLYADAVHDLNELETLRMPGCGIQTISPGAFRNLPKLNVTHLEYNAIEVIDVGIFNHLPIAFLFLHENKIRTIHSEAFDNMPKLSVIKLNQNLLSRWDGDWFANTPKLTQLYFRRNFIAQLPPNAFKNLNSGNLLMIYLSHNTISFVHPQTFEGIDALSELWLDRNQIEMFDRRTFESLTRIDALYLKKNRLTELDEQLFVSLNHKMDRLDVSRNNITCLAYKIVALVKEVIVSGNAIDCKCLEELKNNLIEARLEHTIDDNNKCLRKHN